jgi:hypothetical protein
VFRSPYIHIRAQGFKGRRSFKCSATRLTNSARASLHQHVGDRRAVRDVEVGQAVGRGRVAAREERDDAVALFEERRRRLALPGVEGRLLAGVELAPQGREEVARRLARGLVLAAARVDARRRR